MKTTKKRLVLGIAGAALLCVGAVFTTLAATTEAPITDETMLANIEALSSDESSSSNEWTCWSHVIKSSDKTWQCGNPCEKIDGSPGSGESKCYSRSR